MNTIFKNGKITTLDERQPEVEALFVKDERIVDLGTDRYITDNYRKKAAEIVDLEGCRVVPGFNDAHLHLYQYALAKNKVNLAGVRSFKEIKDRVKKHLEKQKIKKGQWVEGKGWNDKDFDQPTIPDKKALDTITRDHPIILKRACYHVALVNSKALELCGIDKNTPDPDSGKIGRDRDGNPNGILYDQAIDLVDSRIPHQDISAIKKALKDSFQDALSVGLTSVQTDDFINVDNPEDIFKAYLELARDNEIPLRVNLQLRCSEREKITELAGKGYRTGYGDSYLKIGPVKIIGDGSLGARTAALKEPYNDDPSTRGELLYSQEKLNSLVLTAHQNGFQLAIHAIGDAGAELALNSFKHMLAARPGKDVRPIIVHAQIGSHDLFKEMKELGVVAAIQPIFLATDWPIIEKRVSTKRAETSYAWKKMLDYGIPLAGSSDAPIEPFNPLFGVYAAVTRKDLNGQPAGGWHPEDKLSLTQALKLFTAGGAYQSFEESLKGSISRGKLADFVVLSEDIYTINENRIKDINVLQTYVGGKPAYRSG
ncbi:MAG: hypothetical protein PWR10_1166 [Halanaerobiales bacterium]|nr:hypothetical protein [Halanaerobiales bacterium]